MIGDVLVSSIICNNLRKAFPDAQIDYMVYATTTPVLEGNPTIDNLILFKKEHRESKRAFLKLLLAIRKEQYDLIIDSYSKLESWLTVLFSNAKRKISYKKAGRTFLYTDNVAFLQEPSSNLGLTIERRLSLLSPLHLNIELDPIPKLYITQKERTVARELLKSHGIDMTKKVVMISIIGSSDIKTYPLGYMSKVVDFIADFSDVTILFNYIPNQLKDAKTIYDGCKKETQKHIYFDVLGKNLREYIAIMDVCDIIVGNDGGAINIAKSLNKPSFIIFSPWIEKKMWATFEDGKFHKSVHLLDYKPSVFENKPEKELKKNSLEIYKHFKPDYFFKELDSFLTYNLLQNNVLLLENCVDKDKTIKRRHQLSIIIITLNEIVNIDAIIKNASFADEVVIVDSYSTDGTIEAIEKYDNIKFVKHKFSNFSEQRNFALRQASNDWVLFIDGDERITTNLQYEILERLRNPKNIVSFGFYRQFYFKDELLKYSGFQTDKVFRLFNRNYVEYDEEKLVHETLIINGRTSILKNKLDHFSYKDDITYKDKLVKYARLRARELFQRRLKPNFFHYYIKPSYRFLYHYVIRLGFLDGKKGYKIASLHAFGVRQRYIELRKFYSKK